MAGDFPDDFEEQVEAILDEMETDDEAAQRVGLKVIEMADRLKDVAAAVPGARATWSFEIDDVRFNVVVTRDGR